jgi:hypothetical protein
MPQASSTCPEPAPGADVAACQETKKRRAGSGPAPNRQGPRAGDLSGLWRGHETRAEQRTTRQGPRAGDFGRASRRGMRPAPNSEPRGKGPERETSVGPCGAVMRPAPNSVAGARSGNPRTALGTLGLTVRRIAPIQRQRVPMIVAITPPSCAKHLVEKDLRRKPHLLCFMPVTPPSWRNLIQIIYLRSHVKLYRLVRRHGATSCPD